MRAERASRVARAATWTLIALHGALLAAALGDYRVSVDSAYHVALARQYAEHGTYFWDDIHYAPAHRPNLQGPAVHAAIALVGRVLGGDHVLAKEDAGVRFPDTIARTGHWTRRDVVFEIPYRCLTTPAAANLLVAGRCISTTRYVHQATKEIPAAMA